jgi:hypothetical protein
VIETAVFEDYVDGADGTLVLKRVVTEDDHVCRSVLL